jgi:hypothetical protein
MFAEDLTTTTSKLLKIERKTVNRRYEYMCKMIFYYTIKQDLDIRK